MGARLVTLVLTYWADLPDRQFRILLRMAHTALDNPSDGKPAETYWGGHELLAMTLRCPYPGGDRKARAIVLRDVRRDVAALKKAGACEVVGTGRAVRQGHAQTYLLTLQRPDRAGAQIPSSAGAQIPSSAGDLPPIEQGLRSPPRRKEEPSQELSHLHSDGRPGYEAQVEGSHERPITEIGDDQHSSGKGTCSACGQQAGLMRTMTGPVIRNHGRGRDGEPFCPGTGKPPAEAETA